MDTQTMTTTSTTATRAVPPHDRQRRRRAADVPRRAHRRRRSPGARGRKRGAAGQRSADARSPPPGREPDRQGGPDGLQNRRWAGPLRRTGRDHHVRSPARCIASGTPATWCCAARDRSVPPTTSSTSSPRCSHRCVAAGAAPTRSTRRTCLAAIGRSSPKATSPRRSASCCSRSSAPWADSWAAIDGT